MIKRYSVAALAFGMLVLVACGFGTFYSILAVGVSDGLGHIAAQLMLGVCIAGVAVALLLIGKSVSALLMRL